MLDGSKEKIVIGISAGDPSADLLGASLMEVLRELYPQAEFIGTGGEGMRLRGLSELAPFTSLNVNGFKAVLKVLPFFFALLAKWKTLFKTQQIDLLFLIDYPDFNLKLLHHANKNLIPVFYLAPPQMWMWRRQRAKKLRQIPLGCLFDFEHHHYQRMGLKSSYVGFPTPKNSFFYRPESFVLGIFPGSRFSFAKVQFPFYKMVLEELHKMDPRWQVRWVCASEEIENLLANTFSVPNRDLVRAGEFAIGMQWAWCPPGTVSFELAFYGIPTEIFCQVVPLKKMFARRVLRKKYLGLPNLIANRQVFRETYFTKFDSNRIWQWLRVGLNQREEKELIQKEFKNLAGDSEFRKRILEWIKKENHG